MTEADPSAAADHVRRDLVVLFLVAVVLLGIGLGLRDPWPADEPRFVLVARDMVETGEWFFPRVGGELYQDKPPLYFWILAEVMTLIGSTRFAFLLPSLVAALGVVWLVYDLGRRWWGHRTGLMASAALLATVQFVLQAKRAQIDMTLCLFATLALYGLARHLRGGPRWGWYIVGFAAMGAGVITKGVGFLPVLMLVPYAWALRTRWPGVTRSVSWLWLAGPLVMLAVIGVWLVPMLVLVSNSGDVALEAYRNEILFKQTAGRYAEPWGHIKPFWYFVVNVIPPLWLPLSIALPWLVPRWWSSLREKDSRILLLVGWALLVLLFFSASPGKRGVYLLIILPAVALAASPWIEELWRKRGPNRAAFAITLTATIVVSVGAVLNELASPVAAIEASREVGVSLTPTLVMLAAGGLIGLAGFRVRRGVAGLITFTAVLWVTFALWLAPAIDESRSGRQFVEKLGSVVAGEMEIGLVQWREQFLLYIDRPVTHFGHRRTDFREETWDAISWLRGDPRRYLLVDEKAFEACFDHGRFVDEAHGTRWRLVTLGDVRSECVGRGNPDVARTYTIPRSIEPRTTALKSRADGDQHHPEFLLLMRRLSTMEG